MANDCPVILVHGLFGWGPGELAEFPYWGTGHSVPSVLPRREADVGPISSTHDRACELAFQIMGAGRVDYGPQHSAEAGHRRYGRTYPAGGALHPGWSESSPVHLVGHSMGGPTALLLQQLLAEDYFGWGTSERWVASVSSISGPLNGTTATYFLGCDERTGLLDEDGAATFLGHGIEMFVRATGGLFNRFYDFHLEQWGIGAADTKDLPDYVSRIAASPMFTGKDNGAYSLTVQAMLQQDARCRTYPSTYYFSYATERTFPGYLSDHAYPEPGMNPFLIPTALYIGRARYSPPLFTGFHSPDWWANDGLVSTFSQEYPRIAGDHPVGGRMADDGPYRPGAWYHQTLPRFDHVGIVALPPLGQVGEQRRFYESLFDRLAALDVAPGG